MKKRIYPVILGLVMALTLGGLVSAGGFLFYQDLGPVTIISTQFLQVSGRMSPAMPVVKPGEIVSSGNFRIKNPTQFHQGFSAKIDLEQREWFVLHIRIEEQVTPASPQAGGDSTVLPSPIPPSIIVVRPGQEMSVKIDVLARPDAKPVSLSRLEFVIEEEGLPTSPPPIPDVPVAPVPVPPQPNTPSTSTPVRPQPMQDPPPHPAPTYDRPATTQPAPEVPPSNSAPPPPPATR